jgi:hypothetical protein
VIVFSMIALAVFSVIAILPTDDPLALFYVIAWP